MGDLNVSLLQDQPVSIKRYYFYHAFRLLLSFFINGNSVIPFELPGSPALLRAIGRSGSCSQPAAVGFQCHGGSAAGAGKRKGIRSIYRFRRGVFVMGMHPMLMQGVAVNVLLHRRRISVRVLRLLAELLSRTIQGHLHPHHLLCCKHEHGIIVNVIHVVHEHVPARAVVAGHMRELRFPVRPGIRRIGDKIGSTAVFRVRPDVAQVEPVGRLRALLSFPD